MIGMAIAVLATVFGPQVTGVGYVWIVGAMLVGATIGLHAARVVRMTQMPELVALMHSLVGLAAVLVGYANYIDPQRPRIFRAPKDDPRGRDLHRHPDRRGDVFRVGDRLRQAVGQISGKPMLLPGRHWLNLAGLIAVIWSGAQFVGAQSIADGMTPLVVMTVSRSCSASTW